MADPALAPHGAVGGQPAAGAKYAAFISCSHAADKGTARNLQWKLEYYGTALPLRRQMRVFRDETNLAANPDLWGTIQEALDASASLLLLASPEAAASPWVARELAYFLEHHDADRVAVVLTDGWTPWTDDAAEQEPQRKAVPDGLVAEFQKRGWEPLVVDLRPFSGVWAITRWRNAEFLNRTASIVALAARKEKDEVLGTHLRNQRRVTAALSVAAAVFIMLAVLAFAQWRSSERQRKTAFSRELTANAEKVVEADPQLSLLLIKKAASIEKTEQVSDALVAYVRTPGRVVLRHSGPIISAAFSADGQRVVTASEDSSARIWDAASGKQLAELRGHSSSVVSAAFSADGQCVVTASEDSTARIWDAASGKLLVELRGHTGPV